MADKPLRRRRSLGLALAGGAARGLAHIGVIQTLETAGIEADYVSGVSAGAIVGACYAAGMSAAQLADLARRMNWLRIGRPSILNPLRGGLARLGLVDFYPLEMMLIRAIGDLTFEELHRPLAVGASDLTTAEPVIITSGRVARAVRASSSIPGLVAPVRRQGRLLMDGALSNNVPIRVLRTMGADVVLAVNVMPASRVTPTNFHHALSNAVSIVLLRTGDPLQDADLVVEPDLSRALYTWLRADHLIGLGRQAAEPVLPRLQELLA